MVPEHHLPLTTCPQAPVVRRDVGVGILAAARKFAMQDRGEERCVMANDRITVDPMRMNGLPCVRGTRMMVSAVLGQLAPGQSVEKLLGDLSLSRVRRRYGCTRVRRGAHSDVCAAARLTGMKFQVDANLSRQIAGALAAA